MSPMKMTAKRLRRKRICSLRWQTRLMNAVDIVEDARLQMDAIDRDAHEAIQKIIDSKGGWFGPLAMLSMIWAILVQARTAAEAASDRGLGEDRLAGHADSIGHRALTGRQSGTDGASGALPPGWPGTFLYGGRWTAGRRYRPRVRPSNAFRRWSATSEGQCRDGGPKPSPTDSIAIRCRRRSAARNQEA